MKKTRSLNDGSLIGTIALRSIRGLILLSLTIPGLEDRPDVPEG